LKNLRHRLDERVESERLEFARRARLMDELLEEGVNVALPMGECAIDMLAYVNSRTDACTVVSVPIKIVSFSSDALSINLERARASGLLIALVRQIGKPEQVRTFAFTPAELTVVKMIAMCARGNSARVGESPSHARTPQSILQNALEPFAISPGEWRKKIATIVADKHSST
jgi:hypothetical protein